MPTPAVHTPQQRQVFDPYHHVTFVRWAMWPHTHTAGHLAVHPSAGLLDAWVQHHYCRPAAGLARCLLLLGGGGLGLLDALGGRRGKGRRGGAGRGGQGRVAVWHVGCDADAYQGAAARQVALAGSLADRCHKYLHGQ